MKKIIKIGIQDNGVPIYLEGEVSERELELLIKLLRVMLENRKNKKGEIT